jgi:hypothetical protein
MFDRERKQFLSDAKAVFSTEAGKRFLAHLKSTYIASSSLDNTPELTYYRLGQRELVQSFLNIINDPREIDELMSSINYTND